MPNARSILNQKVNSCLPEIDDEALTAHELSREPLKSMKSLKEDKRHCFTEIPTKAPNIRSAKTSSRKMLPSLQQFHGSYFMNKQKPKILKSCSSDILLESAKTNFSSVSEKGHALSHKWKFGLLPPTPSIISSSPKHLSMDRSKENISSHASTTSKVPVPPLLAFYFIPIDSEFYYFYIHKVRHFIYYWKNYV